MNITVEGGKSKKLLTGGKYCPEDIVVTSGGTPPPASEVLDPDVVYQTTRPADWLPMPTPGDDEMYFLCHVAPNRKGAFYVQAQPVNDITVEYGKVVDGAFVADGVLPSTSTSFTKALIEPSMCYSPTADGTLQCMVRIKGNVTTVLGAVATTYEARHCAVDAVCGIALQSLQLGNTSDAKRSWFNLRYWRFVGNGGVASLPQGFFRCQSLLAVGCEKPNVISGGINSAFRIAPSLMAVSSNLISGSSTAVNASYAFNECGLKVIKDFVFACNDMTVMCGESSLLEIDFANIDTSACTSTGGMFYNIYSVRSIKNLNISSLTTIPSNWAINSFNLETLTFAGETTPGGYTITLTSACLGHNALVEMIASLPTATAAATITITNNPGASQLTEDEIAIATAKNWTITI